MILAIVKTILNYPQLSLGVQWRNLALCSAENNLTWSILKFIIVFCVVVFSYQFSFHLWFQPSFQVNWGGVGNWGLAGVLTVGARWQLLFALHWIVIIVTSDVLCSSPFLRAKQNPIKYTIVSSKTCGDWSPNNPFCHKVSSISSVITSAFSYAHTSQLCSAASAHHLTHLEMEQTLCSQRSWHQLDHQP